MKYRLEKKTTQAEIDEFWKKKREYEKYDIFPYLDETGEELEEIISWFQSSNYYNLIMDLHSNSQKNARTLQFAYIYDGIGEYIGFIMYKIYNLEDGKCFILDFCIEREFRNKSIGTEVFTFFEQYVKKNEDATYIALNVSNDRNKRFLEKQGFVYQKLNTQDDAIYVKK
ncbi:GNAT family N-acetyltransferase [Vagococcus carniphilus]|uniref:GNAT family N-acetyltransferase n=1 Tax=Vagococcus carniphilus TaxID=218144 RepID=UPI003BAAB6DC